MVNLPDDNSAILQAHEALYLPNNKYTILYSTQMREQEVAINDTAKHHGGLQNVILDDQDIPLTFNRGLLYVPSREPTDKDLLKWPIVDLTADDPE